MKTVKDLLVNIYRREFSTNWLVLKYLEFLGHEDNFCEVVDSSAKFADGGKLREILNKRKLYPKVIMRGGKHACSYDVFIVYTTHIKERDIKVYENLSINNIDLVKYLLTQTIRYNNNGKNIDEYSEGRGVLMQIEKLLLSEHYYEIETYLKMVYPKCGHMPKLPDDVFFKESGMVLAKLKFDVKYEGKVFVKLSKIRGGFRHGIGNYDMSGYKVTDDVSIDGCDYLIYEPK